MNYSYHHQKGFVILGITLIILFIITGVTLYLTASGILWQRVSVNSYQEEQAFHAAEAGLEFGVMYLGKINTNAFPYTYTLNAPLDDGATYRIVFSNPASNRFSITSTGLNNDATATRSVSQEVYLLSSTVKTPLAAKGKIDLSGSVSITNTQTNETIRSGGAITLDGNAATYISSGVGSDKNGLGSDVTELDPTLSNLSGDAFFQNFFSSSKITIKNSADYLYQNNSNTNYNTVLSGKTDALIWIEQTNGTATIDNATIGSSTNPVVLVVNGALKIGGAVQFYGVLYVIGNWNNGGAGTANITGSVLVEGALEALTGTPNIVFNTSVLNVVNQRIGTYAKVAGSWNDLLP